MAAPVIVALQAAQFDAYFAYLNDHLSDNGQGDTPLFMPFERAQSRLPTEREAAFRQGLATPLDQPGWRRAWVIATADGGFAGHVDLRARPEATAAHRVLLGMGVHRAMRRQGLARALLAHAIGWARAQGKFDWVDLDVMAANAGARALYDSQGFRTVGEFSDMFRLDGQSQGHVLMTLALR